jgi:hypothetical protein
VVLKSGGYGDSLLINRSLTITATGTTANVGAIEINQPSADVVLKGLHLVGTAAPAGSDGIHVTQAASLHIEDCVIERFPDDGIDTGTFADTLLFITRTTVRNNGGIGLITVGINSDIAMLAVDASRVENNVSSGIHIGHLHGLISRTVTAGNGGNGLEMDQSDASVVRTIAGNNSSGGFVVSGQSGSPANLTLHRSTSRGNDSRGLNVSSTGNSTGRVSSSVFTNNGFGIENSDVLLTRENNTVAGNGTDYAGNAPVVLTPQ